MGATTTRRGPDGADDGTPGDGPQELEEPEERPRTGISETVDPRVSNDPYVCEDHGTVHPEDRPWLPKQERGDLAPHPYCPDCGEVEGIGRQRALDRGGLVNLIARLGKLLEREGYTVTDVQKRLILKRLSEADADDAYGLTRSTQMALVVQTASTILGLPETVAHSYLESC